MVAKAKAESKTKSNGAQTTAKQEVHVIRIGRKAVTFFVKGTTPLILNRLSEKTKHELLLPAGRKSESQRKNTLKHNPIREYRDAAHWVNEKSFPTLLALPSVSFKGSMLTAALDIGALSDVKITKAGIGRYCYVEDDYVPIWGTPKLLMSAVRSADMNKTPDIRTRVIVPEWAAVLKVNYIVELMNEKALTNLLAAGGFIAGVGDFRSEKGKGAYGQFVISKMDDPDMNNLMRTAGRKHQIDAIENPEPYDTESRDLLEWWHGEIGRRGWALDDRGVEYKVESSEKTKSETAVAGKSKATKKGAAK